MSDLPPTMPPGSYVPQLTGSRSWRAVVLGLPGRIALLAVVLVVGAMYLLESPGPIESDRFRHPGGYSIIKPRDWDASAVIRPADPKLRDEISLKPIRWIGLEPKIRVDRLSAAPDAEKLKTTGYQDSRFQGRPALLMQQKQKRYTTRRAIFQRNGEWFQIEIILPGLEGNRLDEWWRYAESFQFTAAPATLPM